MTFRNISVSVTATDAGLNTTLNRSGLTVDNFGRRVERSGRLVNTTTAGMSHSFTNLDGIISRGVNRSLTGFVVAATGGYAAGRALKAGIDALVGGAVQFDARMRNVNSIAHLSEGQLHSLGGEVLNLSRRLPQSANTLAEGLYEIESSGFVGTQSLILLNNAGRDASAGLTDTATAVQALDGVVNAYGLQAKDSAAVSDSLFETVNQGVLSFADLAQGIGQVVGTAAAGSVDIDQLGQAIATMTRGGIIPAEAFTSTNQLLSQIIQPGAALAGVFHKLGYESGAAALEQKGLYGVMEDIRRVTGGSVTATSELFTDIRSLRGALALTNNEGKTYRQVIQGWNDDMAKGSPTARAFLEQQKAVAFQWSIVKNEAKAAAISAGTQVLPDLIALMHGVEALGRVLANDGVKHTLEFAAAVYALNKAINIGISIRNSTLATAIAREVGGHTAAAGAITAEAGAAERAIPMLQALAVAENEAAIAAGRLAVSGSVAGVAGASANLEGAGVAIGAGMAANLGRGTGRTLLRGLGRASVVGAVGLGAYELTTSALHGIFGSRFGADPKTGDAAILDNLGPAAHEIYDPLIEQYGNLDTALKVLKETNIETAASQKDLGISHKITTGSMQEELAALQALQKQRDQFTQQVGTAFAAAVDVTQQFDPASGKQAIASAQEQLLTARRSLRQEEQQAAAAKGKPTVSEEQQLATARRGVADATKALATAQRDAAKTGDLSTIYKNDISMAKRFVDDVRTAEESNLDPQLIARLLREGPAQAGPLLDAIVSDHSGRMIHLANQNERVLRRIGVQTIRYAQFVSHAVNAPLADQSRLAKELPKALALDNLLRNFPAPATGAWLADKLGLGPKQVREIARDFGITLPAFIDQTLAKHPVHVRVHADITSSGRGRHPAFADGGLILGPGTGTSDSILARLSNREFVQPEKAVSHYGVGFMEAVRTLSLPRFAEGGMFGSYRPATTTSGQTVVVHVAQPTSVDRSSTTYVDKVLAHDYRDFERQMAAKARSRRAVER